MIQNSEYGNPIEHSRSFLRQMCLSSKQTQNEMQKDGNNNDAHRNICGTYPKQVCDDHNYDKTTIQEQEHFLNDPAWNYFQASCNVESKTDGGCNTTTCTSQPDISQPKDDHTKETVEILNQVSGTREQTDGSKAVPSPAAAVNATEKKDDTAVLKRPMNAFLLFCRIHRKILKNHFTVENREISSKLGKWWGVLTSKEKSPYRQLSKEYRKKMYAIDPNYQWCKRVPARAQVSTCTNEVGANTSLTDVKNDQKNEPVQTITDECLEAAITLVSLRESIRERPLTTFKLADDFNMGSLTKLYTGTGTQQSGDREVAVQTWYNQSSQVMTPCTSGLSVGGPPNQPGEGPSSSRATRACKGKRYNDIMRLMYPRAQSKRPKKPSKKTQKTLHKQLNATGNQTNGNTAVSKAAAKQLLLELYAKVDDLSPMNIDHFLIAMENEKKPKKPPTSPPASPSASPSTAKKCKIQLAPSAKPQSEIPVVVVATDDTVANPSIGTIAQPGSSAAIATEAPAFVQPTSTKPVGSSKRKFPKERITHHPQSEMVERQTIFICHMPDTSDGGTCHARAGL